MQIQKSNGLAKEKKTDQKKLNSTDINIAEGGHTHASAAELKHMSLGG